MKQVAKLVLVDNDNNYLLMYRSDHPTFGSDPDLPGGTLEDGESTLEAVVREVYEEIGVVVRENEVTELYAGTDYSKHDTHYTLYIATVDRRPLITLSWEHSTYEWIPREAFLTAAKNAKDTYMHMVHDILSS